MAFELILRSYTLIIYSRYYQNSRLHKNYENDNGWMSYCATFLVYGENESVDCISVARFPYKQITDTAFF